MHAPATPALGTGRGLIAGLLACSDAVAAVLLAADLVVVIGSVVARSLFSAPVEWSDDVARGLMVGSSFFGAASAVARGENPGVTFFADRLGPSARRRLDALGAVLVAVIAAIVSYNALRLGWLTAGQTTGSGLPLEWTFLPMGGGALFMTVFALGIAWRRPLRDLAEATGLLVLVALAFLAVATLAPDSLPDPGWFMGIGFVVALVGGLPIGFSIALAALIYIWVDGNLPGVIFAQQMARGIDNFVLLAIPFFILVGYLMEANGMSVRLI